MRGLPPEECSLAMRVGKLQAEGTRVLREKDIQYSIEIIRRA